LGRELPLLVGRDVVGLGGDVSDLGVDGGDLAGRFEFSFGPSET